MKKIMLVLLMLFFILWQNIQTAETTNAFSFLKLPVSAKPISCGGAYNSISGDVNSIFYNPAGLNNLNKFELTTTAGLLSLDRMVNSLGIALPTKIGVLGLGIINVGVSKISGYTSDGIQSKEFGYQANTIIISYSKQLEKTVNIGTNLKVLFDNMKDYSRNGLAIDIGILSNIKNNLSIGVKIQDIVGFIGKDVLPISIVVGSSYKLFDNKLSISVDTVYNTEVENIKLRTGIQYIVTKFLSLGCGINNGEMSFGVGINISKLNFYYTFSTDQFNVANLHFISLGLKL